MSQLPSKVFFVGSVRKMPASQVVELLYDQFGDKLLTVPHGEESRLETWAIETLKRTQFEVEGHDVAFEGDSKTYNALRRVTFVGEGEPDIRSDFLPLAREAKELSAAMHQLQSKVGPGVMLPPGLLGVIDPAAWAGFTYMPGEATTWLNAYRRAAVKAVREAHLQDGELEIQLESPYALMSVLAAPKDQREQVAEAEAQKIADTILGTEEVEGLGVPVRIHLCYGDYGGKSWLSALEIPEIDLEPLVLLVNAIQRLCGHMVISYLLPMAAGDMPPSTRRGFYAALAGIDPTARVVIGSVRPEVDDDTNFTAASLAADALRCEVLATSLPCGAGRLSDEKFWRTIRILQEYLRRLQ